MKTYYAIVLLGLYVAPSFAASNSCPSGQQLLDNKKCCPGPLVGAADGSGGDNCCVPSDGANPMKLPVDCKARISLDDPDYDSKLKDAMGSSASGISGSATTTATSTADATGAAGMISVDMTIAGLAGLSAVFVGM